MSRKLRVTVDTVAASPAQSIAAAAQAGALVVLTGRMFDELAAELGGHEPAACFLGRLATRKIGRSP